MGCVYVYSPFINYLIPLKSDSVKNSSAERKVFGPMEYHTVLRRWGQKTLLKTRINTSEKKSAPVAPASSQARNFMESGIFSPSGMHMWFTTKSPYVFAHKMVEGPRTSTLLLLHLLNYPRKSLGGVQLTLPLRYILALAGRLLLACCTCSSYQQRALFLHFRSWCVFRTPGSPPLVDAPTWRTARKSASAPLLFSSLELQSYVSNICHSHCKHATWETKSTCVDMHRCLKKQHPEVRIWSGPDRNRPIPQRFRFLGVSQICSTWYGCPSRP